MSTIYKSEAGASEIQRRYRELLRTWPIPAEQVLVPTREGKTFVLVSGLRTQRLIPDISVDLLPEAGHALLEQTDSVLVLSP